jgi:hypothetical protein
MNIIFKNSNWTNENVRIGPFVYKKEVPKWFKNFTWYKF